MIITAQKKPLKTSLIKQLNLRSDIALCPFSLEASLNLTSCAPLELSQILKQFKNGAQISLINGVNLTIIKTTFNPTSKVFDFIAILSKALDVCLPSSKAQT